MLGSCASGERRESELTGGEQLDVVFLYSYPTSLAVVYIISQATDYSVIMAEFPFLG